MHCAAGRVLGDLFAATEAVGDEDVCRGGGTDGGQEDAFAEGLGNGVVFAFEAERAGHAAAAGVEEFDGGTGAAEPGQLVFHIEDGLVVAVAVEDDARIGVLGRLVVGRVAGEELAEQEGLVGEAAGAVVAGEEVEELVAEDAGATGFEEEEGKAAVDLGREFREDAAEVVAGGIEEAEVVKRAAAADVLAGDLDGVSGGVEDLAGGGEGLGMVVVIPGIGPEESLREVRGLRCVLRAPLLLEGARGEAGQVALGRDA